MHIVPNELDLKFSRFMKALMTAFIHGNVSTSGIRTVDSDSDFPNSYLVNVAEIERSGSVAVANYKTE